MLIDKEKCNGCEICHAYCPVGAITTIAGRDVSVSEILQGDCVECGVCLRSGICPTGAIFMPELKWPRSIRAEFSNPLVPHRSTKEGGRGTEEMKTNDVTGRFGWADIGVAIEMGRPGLGTTFREIQKVSMEIAKLGMKFESHNPVTALMTNTETGVINEEVLDEKVLSAIIEFKIENSRLQAALKAIRSLAYKVNTVFLVGLISRHSKEASIEIASIAKEVGCSVRPNGKINVGLGRPLRED